MVFTGSDQVNFQVGDTIGITYTNGGVIVGEPATNEYNYCYDEIVQPTVGSSFTLNAGSGKTYYSF